MKTPAGLVPALPGRARRRTRPARHPGHRARLCDCGHTLPRGSIRPHNVATTPGSRIFCGGDFSISGDMKTWRELHADLQRGLAALARIYKIVWEL
jgi:hypothetical protein